MEQTLHIEKVVYGGEGLARNDHKVIFVPFTLPEETVLVKITQEKKNFSRGKLLRILKANPERLFPKCPHFGACGGCQLQHADYPLQTKIKQKMLQESLRRLFDPEKIHIKSLEDSTWGYREHIRLGYENGILGFHGFENKDLFQVEACPIFSDALSTLFFKLRPVLKNAGLEKGSIRLLKSNDSWVAAIDGPLTFPKALEELLGLFQGVSYKDAQQTHNIGDPRIFKTVCGIQFEMDPWSFMQNHTKMAEILYQDLLSSLNGQAGLLVDLYCGIGITTLLARKQNLCKKAIGIELNPRAIELAITSASTYQIPNLEFVADDALKLPKYLKSSIDHLFVNPPSVGLSLDVVKMLCELKPKKISYVSCNPSTLARDLKPLLEVGYHLENVMGYDLFPQTTHLETLCVLCFGE